MGDGALTGIADLRTEGYIEIRGSIERVCHTECYWANQDDHGVSKINETTQGEGGRGGKVTL